MSTTSIEWTDRTWNPVRGCSIVSPGCVNCYAMKQAHRFSGPGGTYEGLTKLTKAGPQWTGDVRLVEDALLAPLSWRKPARIFVNSMSDLFHDGVPDAFIAKVFAVMAVVGAFGPGDQRQPFAQRWTGKDFVGGNGPHTFQVLTKRPARAATLLCSGRFRRMVAQAAYEYAKDRRDSGYMQHQIDAREEWGRCYPPGRMWPLSNVWLGVSAENQETADARIPLLLQTPAAVRFISAEPLLGPVTIDRWLRAERCNHPDEFCEDVGCRGETWLDWVIVGGESGSGGRRCNVKWVRHIREACFHAKVPVFVKQLGANVIDRNDAGFMGDEPDHWPEEIAAEDRVEHDLDGTRDGYQGAPVRIHLRDRKGGNPEEWPEDLRVREYPR